MNPDQTAPMGAWRLLPWEHVFKHANIMSPDQIAPIGSSLIRVHIACNIGPLKADKRTVDNSGDWWRKRLKNEVW